MSDSETTASSASSGKNQLLQVSATDKKDTEQTTEGLGGENPESISSPSDNGLVIHWPPPDTPSPSSPDGLDVVIVHGFYGGASKDNLENSENPGSGNSSWVQEYTESLSDLDCRILKFSYDANSIVTTTRSRLTIESISNQLLGELAKLREKESQKRAFMFVAYDIGCIIVKDALATSAVSFTSESEREILDYTRMLVFSGCPHRSTDKFDMQDKISQFLFTTSNQHATKIKPLASSVESLTDAIIEINGLFVDSKVYLRSHLSSIIANKEKPGNINHVFDSYTGALGIPFEKQMPENSDKSDKPIGLFDHLGGLRNYLTPSETDLVSYERILLSLATPPEPFESSPSTDRLFASSDFYQEWLNPSSHEILFVKDTDGARSTSEQIFYALEEKHSDQIILYFSFDCLDHRRNSIKSMLELFITQFLCHRTWYMSPYAQLMFTELEYGRGWTELDLMNWFQRCFYLLHISFVVNNLDDCQVPFQKTLLSFLSRLKLNTEYGGKIAVISREHPPSMSEISNVLFIDPSNNKEAETTRDPGNTLSSLIKLRPDLKSLKHTIQQYVGGVDGFDPLMFNILYEQTKAKRSWSREEFLRASLPGFDVKVDESSTAKTSLESFLDTVLRQIPDTDSVRRVLRWVLYTTRPMTTWELATVMFIGTSQDQGSEAEPSLSCLREMIIKLETWYAGIINIHQNEVRLSHSRLREIFMAPRAADGPLYLWNEIHETADFEITKLCLDYLGRSGARKIIESFPTVGSESIQASTFGDRRNLCSYAIMQWPAHVSRISTFVEPWSLLEKKVPIWWYQGFWALSNPITRPDHPLFSLYTIFVGLGLTYDAKPPNDADLDVALIQAARNSRTDITKFLLKRKTYSQSTLLEALKAATSGEHEQTILDIIDRITATTDNAKIDWPASLLYRAAFLGLDQFAKKLLDLGCVPEPGGPVQEKHGITPLFLAARWGNHSTVRVLIEKKANIQFADEFGKTALNWAMIQRDPEVARALVEEGKADVDFADTGGFTALYTACDLGHYAVVQTMLQLGADPNKTCATWAPLIKSANDGFIECVRALLEGDANPDIPNPSNSATALSYAATRGYLDICRLLVAKGADINHPIMGPPIICEVVLRFVGAPQQSTQLEIIKFLVENGADVNAKASNGLAALSNAIYMGDEAIVQYFLKHGADANSSDDTGRVPLYFAVGQPGHREKAISFSRALLEHGADLNQRNTEGTTSLMITAWNDYTEVAKFLLEQPKTIVDLEVEGTSETQLGWTALSYAVRNNFKDMVRLLADHGANLQHRDNDGLCPIHILALFEPVDALRVLLEYRKRIDIEAKTTSGGSTALLRAVNQVQVPLENIKALINAGANVNATDDAGDTAISWCAYNNNQEAALLFLKQEDLDINISSPRYGNALHQGCRQGNFDLVKLLVDHGADVNLICESNPGTPLQCACMTWDSNRGSTKDILSYLIANGANVKAAGGRSGSVMAAAAFGSTPDAVRLLLDHGAPLDIIDEMGRWPIHVAANNTLDIFKTCVKAGGDITVHDKLSRTALHCAALYGNAEVVEYLLENMKSAVVDEPDIDGWTPLCWGVRGLDRYFKPYEGTTNRLKVVQLLLEKKADRFVQCTIGEEKYSVLKIAKYSNAEPEIISLLKKGGRRHSKDSARDNSYKDVKPGSKARRFCDYCHWSIRGIAYSCKNCIDFDFCNKCYHRRNIIHPAEKYPDHEFEKLGQEFDPTPPHSRKSSKSSSSSSSSGWGGDSDEEEGKAKKVEKGKGEDSDDY